MLLITLKTLNIKIYRLDRNSRKSHKKIFWNRTTKTTVHVKFDIK